MITILSVLTLTASMLNYCNRTLISPYSTEEEKAIAVTCICALTETLIELNNELQSQLV